MPKKKQAQAGATGVEGVKKEIFNLFAKKDASAFNQCIDLINESKIDASLKKDFMEYIVQIIRDELKQSREKQDFTTVTITLYFLKELKLDQSVKNGIINEFRILHNELSAKEDEQLKQSQQADKAQATVGGKSTKQKVSTKQPKAKKPAEQNLAKSTGTNAGKKQSKAGTQVGGKTKVDNNTPAVKTQKPQAKTPIKSADKQAKKPAEQNLAKSTGTNAGKKQSKAGTQVGGKTKVDNNTPAVKTKKTQAKTPIESAEKQPKTPAKSKEAKKETKIENKENEQTAGNSIIRKSQGTNKTAKTAVANTENKQPKEGQKSTILAEQGQKTAEEKSAEQNPAEVKAEPKTTVKNKEKQDTESKKQLKPLIKKELINMKPKQLTQAEIDAKVKELFTRGTLDSITNFLRDYGEKVSDEQKLKLINILSTRTNSDGLYFTARDIDMMHFSSDEIKKKAIDRLSSAMLKKNSKDDVGLMYSYIVEIKGAPVDDLIEKMAKICGGWGALKDILQSAYGDKLDSNIEKKLDDKIAESGIKPE